MRLTLAMLGHLLLVSAPALAAPPPDADNPAADKPAADKPGGDKPDPLPTVEEIRKLIDGGNGAEALKQLNRLLALRGKAAAPYEKYELLTLKGDAHLKLRANEAAASSFRQAAADTEDKVKQATARATEQLIRRSKNLAYTPKKVAKGGAAEPIDVVEPESRQRALAALFVDEAAPVLPKLEAAKDAKSVGPMIKAMQAARELEYLELAANGSADQVAGMVAELKDRGKQMLAKVMERAAKRTDRIAEMANEMENVKQIMPTSRGGYRSVTVQRRRGVQREDVTELKGIIDACDEVEAQAKALVEATGADEEEVEEIVDAAEDLKVHVQRMLRVHEVNYEGRREARNDD